MQEIIFIADVIACSTCFGHHYVHHQELENIIQVVAACGVWCFGFHLYNTLDGHSGAPKHVEQAIRSAIKIICCI